MLCPRTCRNSPENAILMSWNVHFQVSSSMFGYPPMQELTWKRHFQILKCSFSGEFFHVCVHRPVRTHLKTTFRVKKQPQIIEKLLCFMCDPRFVMQNVREARQLFDKCWHSVPSSGVSVFWNKRNMREICTFPIWNHRIHTTTRMVNFCERVKTRCFRRAVSTKAHVLLMCVFKKRTKTCMFWKTTCQM